STAQTVLYGSYFGGSQNDYPTAGINILQSSGCVVMAGGVHSLPFPVTPGVFLTTRDNSTTPDQPAVVKVCLSSILPIILLDFELREENQGVLVKWGTISEKNNDHFEVLKSTDGVHFYSIGRVEGNGNSTNKTYYSLLDNNKTLGKSYYKIQQVDYNGESSFSDTRSISIQNLKFLTVAPNPGNGILNLESFLSVDAEVKISVQNILAEELYHSEELASKGAFTKTIQIDQLASGMYLIQLTSGNDAQVVKYIKQ
ncbi:MAG: T9SS type A sorting domain-containing protein, partial [Cytophagales bacterium]|nr:T9SS type A sorting domain-containing protein [Cytophagales bacterium]